MINQGFREINSGADGGSTGVLGTGGDVSLSAPNAGVNQLLAQFLSNIGNDSRTRSIVIEQVRDDGTVLSRAIVGDGHSFTYDGEPDGGSRSSVASGILLNDGGTDAVLENPQWTPDELSALMSAFDELDATADRIIASMDRSHDLLLSCIREANAAHDATASALSIHAGVTA